MENSIGVCGFLFALAARELRVKFAAKLPSLWLFGLHVLNNVVFLPRPPLFAWSSKLA